MLLGALATGAALPAVAEGPEFPPFAIGDVDFEPQCYPNPAFGRLLTLFNFGGGAAREGDEWVADWPVYQAVSGETSVRLMLDQPADWHGLHLGGVEVYRGIERGPANYTLVFHDAPERVREVWNARGWNLPLVNEARDIAGLEGYTSIMVGSGEDGTASVTCFRD
jgi:hypothetical protein